MKRKKISEKVQSDIDAVKRKETEDLNSKKYKLLISRISRAEKERDAVKAIREVTSFTIRPTTGVLGSEATAVVLASDWHYSERVRSSEVNGLNEFNIEIAKERISQFFIATARMIKVFSKDIKIKNLVLALLGDFVSGSIHEELLETNQCSPIDETIEVQACIASGIKYLLSHCEVDIVIPCHSGNHARLSKKQHHATESGHSIEYYMYHNLARHFKSNPRVKFLISPSYHSYLKVYDYTIRFHHGHNLKYQGGIGGLFIPVFKAISQWNKGCRADWDFFGHWHSMRDGGNFICNGSVVGYNAYALSIKAEFEKPKQAFILIDKKRGKTVVTPICFDD
jgi:hypothetical protein